MPYCTRCGTQIEEGARCECMKQTLDYSSISGFFASLATRTGIGNFAANRQECYERGQKIVPDNVELNDGEVPIKQYNLCKLRSRLKLMFAEGRIQVTNKRLLFRASGISLTGKSCLQYEFSIEHVAGVQVNRNYRFSLLDLLFAFFLSSCVVFFGLGICALLLKMKEFGMLLSLVLGCASFAPMFLFEKRFLSKYLCGTVGLGLLWGSAIGSASRPGFAGFLGTLCLIAGVIGAIFCFAHACLFSFKPNLIFNVQTSMGSPVIPVRCEPRGFASFLPIVNASFTGYNEVLPWTDTDAAIRELGAMINDIQKLGDFAIEKWKT